MNARAWIVIALLLMAFAAPAAGPRAVRKQVESTLLLTGTIQIDESGRVGRFTIDHRDRIPPAALELAQKSIPTWVFQPVLEQGRPLAVTSSMRVRLVAKRMEDERFKVEIRSASFGGDRATTQTPGPSLQPPSYPMKAARAGVSGLVFVALRLDEAGAVADAVAEQTNLRVVATEAELAQWRGLLEQAALRAARQWRFDPTRFTSPGEAEPPTLRVPVDFTLVEDGQQSVPDPGRWEAYVPGPRHAAPWLPSGPLAAEVADALVPGGIYDSRDSLRLLTPLGPG